MLITAVNDKGIPSQIVITLGMRVIIYDYDANEYEDPSNVLVWTQTRISCQGRPL